IFAVAGFVFSWERALLSLLTYFIALKLIDVVVNGVGDEDKGITILTEKGEEIAEVVYARLGRATTFIPTIGAYSKKQTYSPYIVINRIEKTKLVDIVKEIDPNAMIIVSPISGRQRGTIQKARYSLMKKRGMKTPHVFRYPNIHFVSPSASKKTTMMTIGTSHVINPRHALYNVSPAFPASKNSSLTNDLSARWMMKSAINNPPS